MTSEQLADEVQVFLLQVLDKVQRDCYDKQVSINDERTLMETMDKQVVVLTTDCTCTDEDGGYTPDCYGCYDDEKGNLHYLLKDWAEANNFDADKHAVRVDGKAMLWLRRDGYAIVEFDSLLDALTLRGDYTLTFTLEGASLKCVRTSHDEPTGAFFQFSLTAKEEEV